MKDSWTWWTFGALVVAVVMTGLMDDRSGRSDGSVAEKPQAPLDERQRAAARQYCRAGLQQVLNDPGSAEWGAFSGNFYASWRARNEPDGWVTVWPRFRARNGFGALVLSEWRCRVRLSGETLVEFEALDPL